MKYCLIISIDYHPGSILQCQNIMIISKNHSVINKRSKYDDDVKYQIPLGTIQISPYWLYYQLSKHHDNIKKKSKHAAMTMM